MRKDRRKHPDARIDLIIDIVMGIVLFLFVAGVFWVLSL